MAEHLSGLVDRLSNYHPGLRGFLSSEFSSNQPGHRQAIRRSVREHLGLSDSEHDHLENLEHPPTLSNWSVSISHCHQGGGWVAVPGPKRIGLDLEVQSRIHERLVQRVANPGELDQIPDASFLWCAKEAYFKALSKDQPVAITQLYIDSWFDRTDGSFTFSGASDPRGEGLILRSGPLLVSICII